MREIRPHQCTPGKQYSEDPQGEKRVWAHSHWGVWPEGDWAQQPRSRQGLGGSVRSRETVVGALGSWQEAGWRETTLGRGPSKSQVAVIPEVERCGHRF